MIDLIYQSKSKQEQVRKGPLFSHYESFIHYMIKRGYLFENIKPRLSVVNFLNDYLHRRRIKASDLTDETIKEFSGIKKPNGHSVRSQELHILALLMNHLREEGIVSKNDGRFKKKMTRIDLILSEYRDYLIKVRNSSKDTVKRNTQHARNFLNFIGKTKISNVSGELIQEFMTRKKPINSVSYNQYEASALRIFLKYLFVIKKTRRDLSLSVLRVANWKGTKIPEILGLDKVSKTLESIDRDSKTGKRD